jgi:hypothetical protein
VSLLVSNALDACLAMLGVSSTSRERDLLPGRLLAQVPTREQSWCILDAQSRRAAFLGDTRLRLIDIVLWIVASSEASGEISDAAVAGEALWLASVCEKKDPFRDACAAVAESVLRQQLPAAAELRSSTRSSRRCGEWRRLLSEASFDFKDAQAGVPAAFKRAFVRDLDEWTHRLRSKFNCVDLLSGSNELWQKCAQSVLPQMRESWSVLDRWVVGVWQSRVWPAMLWPHELSTLTGEWDDLGQFLSVESVAGRQGRFDREDREIPGMLVRSVIVSANLLKRTAVL